MFIEVDFEEDTCKKRFERRDRNRRAVVQEYIEFHSIDDKMRNEK